MTTNNDVPLALRPVLEALRDAAGWMRMEVQCEEDARRTAQKQHVAWLDLEARCARALASDAGMPEGEPFFHQLGCPRISSRGTAAHCTCLQQTPPSVADAGAPEGAGTPYSIAMAEGTAVEQADERQLLEALGKAAAPDAELDRLLEDYGEEWGERARMQVGWTEGDLARSVAIIAEYRAAVHAYVERVKRDAYADGHRAGARIMAQVHRDSRREKEEG